MGPNKTGISFRAMILSQFLFSLYDFENGIVINGTLKSEKKMGKKMIYLVQVNGWVAIVEWEKRSNGNRTSTRTKQEEKNKNVTIESGRYKFTSK